MAMTPLADGFEDTPFEDLPKPMEVGEMILANMGHRDVIQMILAQSEGPDISPEERREIALRDLHEYVEWLANRRDQLQNTLILVKQWLETDELHLGELENILSDGDVPVTATEALEEVKEWFLKTVEVGVAVNGGNTAMSPPMLPEQIVAFRRLMQCYGVEL